MLFVFTFLVVAAGAKEYRPTAEAFRSVCISWSSGGMTLINSSAPIAFDPDDQWLIGATVSSDDAYHSQQSLVPALEYYQKNMESFSGFVLPDTSGSAEIVAGFKNLHGGTFAVVESETAHCFSNFVLVAPSRWLADSLAPFARACIVSGCSLSEDPPPSAYDVLLYRRAHEDGGSLRSVSVRLAKEGLRVDSHTLNASDSLCIQYAAIRDRARTPVVITIHGTHETTLALMEPGTLVIEIQTRSSRGGMFCGPFEKMVLLTHSIHRREEPYETCEQRGDVEESVVRHGAVARGGVYLSPDEVATVVRLTQEHLLVS